MVGLARREKASEGERRREKAREGEGRREKARKGKGRREKAKEGERRGWWEVDIVTRDERERHAADAGAYA